MPWAKTLARRTNRIATSELCRNFVTALVRAARRFLEEGNCVKLQVRYRGRERTHPERARAQIDAMSSALAELARLEGAIKIDARAMSALFVPKKKTCPRPPVRPPQAHVHHSTLRANDCWLRGLATKYRAEISRSPLNTAMAIV